MEGFTNFDFYNYIFADNIGIDIFVRFKRVVMEYRQFLDGVNRKEDKAWVELYDYFYAPLCCYSAKIMGNDQMVEDVVQGCFVKLWLSTVCFEDIKVITAYLYRAVYNAALNFVRDQKRSKKAHEVWMGQVVSDESDAVEMALEEEAITRFYTVITRLPEQQRDILLRSMKGERVRDMAEKLGISENTVKTQKKRAYAFVREQLGDVWMVIVGLFFV